MRQRNSASCVVDWHIGSCQQPTNAARFARSGLIGSQSLLLSLLACATPPPGDSMPLAQTGVLVGPVRHVQAFSDVILPQRSSVCLNQENSSLRREGLLRSQPGTALSKALQLLRGFL